MFTSLFSEKNLLFIGSRERLARTVSRNSGKLLPGNRFDLPVVSPVHKGIGLTFTVLGIFEQAEAGYLIKYRIVPTWPTILRFSVYFILVLPLLFSNLNEGHKLAIWFAFLGSVILIVLSFIKHHQQCEQFFLKLFEKATTSKQERV